MLVKFYNGNLIVQKINDLYGNSSDHANLGTLTKDAWNHVAYVKQGSTYRAYKNGVQMDSGQLIHLILQIVI